MAGLPPLSPISERFAEHFISHVKSLLAQPDSALSSSSSFDSAALQTSLVQWLHRIEASAVADGSDRFTDAHAGGEDDGDDNSRKLPFSSAKAKGTAAEMAGLERAHQVDACCFHWPHHAIIPAPWRYVERQTAVSPSSTEIPYHMVRAVRYLPRVLREVGVRGTLHHAWAQSLCVWTAASGRNRDSSSAEDIIQAFAGSLKKALDGTDSLSSQAFSEAMLSLLAHDSSSDLHVPADGEAAGEDYSTIMGILAEVMYYECCVVAEKGVRSSFRTSPLPTSVLVAALEYVGGSALAALKKNLAHEQSGSDGEKDEEEGHSSSLLRVGTLCALALRHPMADGERRQGALKRARTRRYDDSDSDDDDYEDDDSDDSDSPRADSCVFNVPLAATVLTCHFVSVDSYGEKSMALWGSEQHARVGDLQWSVMKN